MEIIHERHTVETEYFVHEFVWADDPGAGFSFDTDAQGNVIFSCVEAEENYRKCTDGTFRVIDKGIRRYVSRYVEPAEGKCACGNVVALEGFTNTCEDCGRDYNSSGQLLAPRSQWGEETGETLSDILSIR